jgi:hypothetical protein
VRTAISLGDLDLLAGEVLPERTVLSTVVTPFNNYGGDNGGAAAAAAAASGDGGGHSSGPAVVSSCVNQQQAGSQGLLALGLAPTPPTSSQLCTPAAIVG